MLGKNAVDYRERYPTLPVESEGFDVFALVFLGEAGDEFVAIKTGGHFLNGVAIIGKERTKYSLDCDNTSPRIQRCVELLQSSCY
jgi:hypothetical protein